MIEFSLILFFFFPLCFKIIDAQSDTLLKKLPNILYFYATFAHFSLHPGKPTQRHFSVFNSVCLLLAEIQSCPCYQETIQETFRK